VVVAVRTSCGKNEPQHGSINSVKSVTFQLKKKNAKGKKKVIVT
jgi:hypothetical protein